MSPKQMNIPDFCAHAADELREVEQGHTVVALTRDGQIIAYLSPAPKPTGTSGTLADWTGTGSGFTLAPGSNLEDPAWESEEWEEFPGSDSLSDGAAS